MYLVACKWIANGDAGYKRPMEYLSLPDATDAQMEYAVAIIVLTPELEKTNSVVNYAWLEDPAGLDRISLTYYVDQASFDAWNTSAPHTTFLDARNKFLTATGIQLIQVDKEVEDLIYSTDFATANQLFS